MKIEVLFRDIMLFGDESNVGLLQKCLPDAEFVFTGFESQPLFALEKPDLIYMGALTESAQKRAIEYLLPYRDRLAQLIEDGANFLITSNSLEIFGKYIEDSGEKTACLSLFDYYARRDMFGRINNALWGEFEGMDIVGFKSQFSRIYGNTDEYPFIKSIRGTASNPETVFEGVHRNNFYATYLLGPFLVLNPPFLRYFLNKIGAEDAVIPFEDAMLKAYNARLSDMRDKNRVI